MRRPHSFQEAALARLKVTVPLAEIDDDRPQIRRRRIERGETLLHTRQGDLRNVLRVAGIADEKKGKPSHSIELLPIEVVKGKTYLRPHALIANGQLPRRQ